MKVLLYGIYLKILSEIGSYFFSFLLEIRLGSLYSHWPIFPFLKTQDSPKNLKKLRWENSPRKSLSKNDGSKLSKSRLNPVKPRSFASEIQSSISFDWSSDDFNIFNTPGNFGLLKTFYHYWPVAFFITARFPSESLESSSHHCLRQFLKDCRFRRQSGTVGLPKMATLLEVWSRFLLHWCDMQPKSKL